MVTSDDLHGGHVLVSPEGFRGSLVAPDVARHIAAGLQRARPGLPVVLLPVPDGGEGTVEAAVSAGWKRIEIEISGPTGIPLRASLAVDEDTAIVELSEACGMRRLPGGRPQPLITSSIGAGQLIAEAVRLGMRRIVLGMADSAAVDGGAGIVQALGGRLLDVHGRPLPPGGAALRTLHALDLRTMADFSGIDVVIAGQINGPLLGRQGAAMTSGGPTGIEARRVLESGLRRWADLTEAAMRRPIRDRAGAGASGGAGFAAMAFLQARVVPGSAYMLDLLGFAEKVRGARLVITGEGSLDSHTLRGRASMSVAKGAARAAVPVVAVAGRRGLTGEQLRRARFQGAYALSDIERDPERCMRQAGPLLEQLMVAVADEWL